MQKCAAKWCSSQLLHVKLYKMHKAKFSVLLIYSIQKREAASTTICRAWTSIYHLINYTASGFQWLLNNNQSLTSNGRKTNRITFWVKIGFLTTLQKSRCDRKIIVYFIKISFLVKIKKTEKMISPKLTTDSLINNHAIVSKHENRRNRTKNSFNITNN